MTPRRLLIVSHVVHYEHEGAVLAYGPYAREIEIWADLFAEVAIACPVRRGPAAPDALPIRRDNVRVWPVAETGGRGPGPRLHQLSRLPGMIGTMAAAIGWADAVHVRCPGNLGLLGAALAPLSGKPRVAKFAGQWNGYDGEVWTGRLQRWLLRRWWAAPVLVYGEWPGDPAHIVPFFTSMMTDEQVDRAAAVAATKTIGSPLKVLFAGRLEPVKRVDALLEAAGLLEQRGVPAEIVVLGDGSQRHRLERLAADLPNASPVRFVGALPFDEALAWYAWADCLVLPSEHSEGWPKVVAEAMCHGVVCVAVDHGQVRRMLDGRGVVLSSGAPAEIAAALADIASAPTRYSAMSKDASQWARGYSLEGMRAALAALLSDRWATPMTVGEGRR